MAIVVGVFRDLEEFIDLFLCPRAADCIRLSADYDGIAIKPTSLLSANPQRPSCVRSSPARTSHSLKSILITLETIYYVYEKKIKKPCSTTIRSRSLQYGAYGSREIRVRVVIWTSNGATRYIFFISPR